MLRRRPRSYGILSIKFLVQSKLDYIVELCTYTFRFRTLGCRNCQKLQDARQVWKNKHEAFIEISKFMRGDARFHNTAMCGPIKYLGLARDRECGA